jgi:uncharacterized membrane protein
VLFYINIVFRALAILILRVDRSREAAKLCLLFFIGNGLLPDLMLTTVDRQMPGLSGFSCLLAN